MGCTEQCSRLHVASGLQFVYPCSTKLGSDLDGQYTDYLLQRVRDLTKKSSNLVFETKQHPMMRLQS